MKNTILVYGFYGKSNVGDDLFMEAFQNLFPEFRCIFTDKISELDLDYIDIVFFGGGSFLNIQPNITDGAIKLLLKKKIFYIGVGAETQIHSTHRQLMSNAELIAIRSPNLETIKKINKNTIYIPDIIYSLQDKVIHSNKICKSVLILPNIYVVPNWEDSQWKHAAWNHFKCEFAQFIDWLIEQDYYINFFSMCKNNLQHDDGAIYEIINMMNYKNNEYIITNSKTSIENVTALISKYNTVITQRYHGIVLSNMVGTHSLSISHHDKLKNEHSICFYETSKDKLISQFNETNNRNILPIDRDIFTSLQQSVLSLI